MQFVKELTVNFIVMAGLFGKMYRCFFCTSFNQRNNI